MNFDPYRIVRLISSDRGVSFYEAVNEEDKKTYLLRVFEESGASPQSVDDWYNLYGQYQELVTNFKHLPRVKEMQSPSPKQVYVVLHHEPGKILRERQGLNAEQMEQLLDAVMHLHAKGLVHGAFTPDRVWITDEGKVILYGALEWQGAKAKQPTQATDVAQLVHLFVNFADLPAERVLELKSTAFKSLEQIQQFLQKPLKAGLVEKEPIKREQPPIVEPKRAEKPIREERVLRNEPVRQEQPMQNQRTHGPERPFQSEQPYGNQRPGQNQQPFGNESSSQNEQPYGNHRPSQNRQPFPNERLYPQQNTHYNQTFNPNQRPFPNEQPLPKKRNLPLLIGLGLVAAVILVGVAFEVGKLSNTLSSSPSSRNISSGVAGTGGSDNANQSSDTSQQDSGNSVDGSQSFGNGSQSPDSGSSSSNFNGNSSADGSGSNFNNGSPSTDGGSSNFNNNGTPSTDGNSSKFNNGTPSADGSSSSFDNNGQATYGSSADSGNNNGNQSPFNANDPGSEVPSMVMQYMSSAVQAVDQNDFTQVEPWLIPDSNLYKQEQAYISNINSQGITEEMLANDVVSVSPSPSQANTYDVVVSAKYKITNSSGKQSILDESDQFVVYDDGHVKGLSDIAVLSTKTE